MSNWYKSSISSKYANFSIRLGWRSANDWWYSIFLKFDPATISNNPNMLDNVCVPGIFGPYPIGNFRCRNWWYICTTTFYLCIDASNTVIISLWRYSIKCNYSYPTRVFLGVSSKNTWPLICSLFWANPLALWNISPVFYSSVWPSFSLMRFSLRIFSRLSSVEPVHATHFALMWMG